MMRICLPLTSLLVVLTVLSSQAQPDASKTPPTRYDLSKEPVLYTVGYAHLDTEWRWDYETTIREYLKNTLDENFLRFEAYKPYIFTFSGARRYKMMKEYYPEKYERLKKYIAQGRWFVGGSSVDECDVNVPSPESVIRQTLYGNGYFRSEFGKESVDFLLPDCFGFQAYLPSALAHAGLKGFSTQKLSWGSASGIPFNIGNWTGPDGNGIIAALNATTYGGEIKKRLDTSSYWINRIMENGMKYGIYADYRYYGVGDEGGAPREDDVKNAIGSLDQPDGKLKVYLCSSDQLFRDLSPEQKNQLPSFSGDLLLTQHSAGSLTSQAYMKRWNRKNEQLALATEPLAVMADWLGGIKYPQRALNEAWWLVLGSQMHDILPGTCIPKAYEYAWNDEVLALNKFASVLESSAGAVVRAMDTRGKGKTLTIYNPLAIARKEAVEAEISYPEGAPKGVVVMDTSNNRLPVQILDATRNSLHILLLCTVPPLGMACFDIQPVNENLPVKSTLNISEKGLENEFLKVTINSSGDISGLFDKKLGKEMLSAPMRMEFQKEHPQYWPAWNMDWNDRKNPPMAYVTGPAKIIVLEKGPVRATVCIERTALNSVFTQYIQLVAGKEPLIVRNTIRWQSRGVSLKASFPLTASNTNATYNMGLGTIERSNNDEKKFEVPSREWFDLTDKSGSYGVTIFEDSKFGSDKPNDKTLRLTLLYTPATNFYHDQATQDWGIHEVTYGIYPHKGDWRTGLSEWQGRALNQPMRAFQVSQHPGFLGKIFSFARISSPQVDIRTIKKAENGKDVVIRIQELFGKDIQNVEIAMASKILKAWEIDGQERLIGEAVLKNGKLMADMGKFAIRSFALQLEAPAQKVNEPVSMPIPLIYDQDVVSRDKNRRDGRFDENNIAIPSELLPETMIAEGIQFNFGPKADGKNNVMVCKGQKVILPRTGNYNNLYILAAALKDTSGIFKAGSLKYTLQVQSYHGNIGQFDNRSWDKYQRMTGLQKGFIKRDEVAWFATHIYQDSAMLPYKYAYVYKYRIPANPASEFLQLPENENIKIFAITAAENFSDQAQSVYPLYDDFSKRPAMELVMVKSYVTENLTPVMEIRCHSNRNIAKLPARLTMKDYADIHQPNGVTVHYYFTGADSTLTGSTTLTGSSTLTGSTTPSGSITSSMAVTALNDGMYDLLPGDSLNDRWSEKGEGRVLMDLQQETELDSLHLFAEQSTRRGGQSFSLWGATGEKCPSVKGDPKAAGWSFLALAPPEDLWGNSKALYTITPKAGKQAQYRYLLWVSEDTPHGPFYFREADVFEKQK